MFAHPKVCSCPNCGQIGPTHEKPLVASDPVSLVECLVLPPHRGPALRPIHDQPAEGGNLDHARRPLRLGQHPEEEPDQSGGAPGHRWHAQKAADCAAVLPEQETSGVDSHKANEQTKPGPRQFWICRSFRQQMAVSHTTAGDITTILIPKAAKANPPYHSVSYRSVGRYKLW